MRIGISVGDLNGIGLEVALKAFADRRMLKICTPVLFGSAHIVQLHQRTNGIDAFPLNVIQSIDQSLDGMLNVLEVWQEDVKVAFGQNSENNAKFAIQSLTTATEYLVSNKIDALVTAPIDKHSMQQSGFAYAGHTEYLAAMAKSEEVLMVMAGEDLRIGTVTGHIALEQVAATITEELIMGKVRLMARSLEEDLRIQNPRVAVLALDPHAGDRGTIGHADQKIVEPAIAKLKEEGLQVFGPFPADGFFGSTQRNQFDGVMAMYHDQGLIPFKTICFGNGVNLTAGLPFVRTSPVHGTALAIAGQGKADPSSFCHAISLAVDICHNRKLHQAITEKRL